MPKWMVIETDHPDSPLVDVRVRQYPCTMLDLPLRESRGWYLNTHRVILGQLEPGDSSVVRFLSITSMMSPGSIRLNWMSQV